MGILKCAHGMSDLDWRVTSDGKVEVRVSETPDSAGGGETEWQCYGPVLEVLDRVADRAFERTELTWRTELSYSNVVRKERKWNAKTRVFEEVEVEVRVCNDSDQAISRIRNADESREVRLLSQVAFAVGMRLDASKWRMLSPNAVIHFQFGVGVTVATDGTNVILFSEARFGTDCAVVHRSNVVGPVTATPVRTEDYNYVANKTSTAKRGEHGDCAQKIAKETKVLARAMAALESLLS